MNVDKVFIINLERRTDRKQQTSKELERVGIKNYEFFPAIEPKNLTVIEKWNPNFLKKRPKWLENKSIEYYNKYRLGALGCLMSHAAVIDIALKRNYKRILILEDDIFFKTEKKISNYKHLNTVLKYQCDLLRKKNHSLAHQLNNFDILYLGGSCCSNGTSMLQITNNIYRAQNIGGTFAYILSNKSMRLILRLIRSATVEIDKFYIETIQTRQNSYFILPSFIIPLPGYSDIRQKDMVYNNALNV